MSPVAVVNGNSVDSGTFFRRTSTGSRPSSLATRSMMRSIMYAASGRPAPRYASVDILFVVDARDVHPHSLELVAAAEHEASQRRDRGREKLAVRTDGGDYPRSDREHRAVLLNR